jgi:voltage-gated potassium channel Kch
MWQSMLRVVDPGTMADDTGWLSRLLALLVTITGLLLLSALIGIVATGIDQKIEQLRKGRSIVLETGHTVILGWSPRLFTIVSELVIANENHPGQAIAVLADRDKTEMEDEIKSRVGSLNGTRLVCRTGDPASPGDLELVSIDTARSIVVLGDDGPTGDADAVKIVLAARCEGDTLDRVPVVAEMTEERTARALRDACRGRVLTVCSTHVVARVTAQSCRQSGLSLVVEELLNFDGDEIYMAPIPELSGHTFGEALLAFETSSVIGLKTSDGTITVNPPMATVIAEGDLVIAISEDDDTVTFTGMADGEVIGRSSGMHLAPLVEDVLVVGWNRLGPEIFVELDQFVAPGSRAEILVDAGLVDPDKLDIPPMSNFEVNFTPTTEEAEDLAVAARERSFTSVIILGYRLGVTPDEADARTLLTLLLLEKGIQEGDHGHDPKVVAELLDAKDVELARITGADDFVVSDALSSLMMAQLSEHPDLAQVFEQLYTAEGSALHMQPASDFATAGEVSYADIVATVRTHGKIAIGWRQAPTATQRSTVVVNPAKSHRLTLTAEDHVIVVG